MNKITMILVITDSNAVILKQRHILQKFLDNGNCIIALFDSNCDAGINVSGDIQIFRVNDLETDAKTYNYIAYETDKTQNDILIIPQDARIGSPGFYNEMRECLYAFERHAVIFARNEIKRPLMNAAEKYLPRITMLPFNTGGIGAALIKRSIINTFGFLPYDFDNLKHALLDFCCRISIYGYSTVYANHTFVYCAEDDPAPASDDTIFVNRYGIPIYNKSGIDAFDMHPCEWFIDMLAEDKTAKPKILFEYSSMVPYYNGTSEFQLSLLASFYKLYNDRYDITVFTFKETDEFHGLSKKYPNVCYPDTITGTYHLGISATQPYYTGNIVLNRFCLKNIYTILDIITLRCPYIQAQADISITNAHRQGVFLADGIVAISNYSVNDYHTYSSYEQTSTAEKPIKTIYPASAFPRRPAGVYELPYEKYYLLPGSKFYHKCIRDTIKIFNGTDYNLVILGVKKTEIPDTEKNIYTYESGRLTEDFISFLYSRCEAVIFPSVYEGFGLPVLIALNIGKHIILHNNALNTELKGNCYNYAADRLHFFDRFSEIPQIIQNINLTNPTQPGEYNRTWDDVACEYEEFIREVLSAPIDIDKLLLRRTVFAPLTNQFHITAAEK